MSRRKWMILWTAGGISRLVTGYYRNVVLRQAWVVCLFSFTIFINNKITKNKIDENKKKLKRDPTNQQHSKDQGRGEDDIA